MIETNVDNLIAGYAYYGDKLDVDQRAEVVVIDSPYPLKWPKREVRQVVHFVSRSEVG
jgi:hypothetical protein